MFSSVDSTSILIFDGVDDKCLKVEHQIINVVLNKLNLTDVFTVVELLSQPVFIAVMSLRREQTYSEL